jgi:signal transduction histidine kinase/HAMP domain-containing protein
VAREVGTEGRLGGQAQVPGVAGTWKDLTDNVNLMASNLTDQVRGISQVVTSVANGDLSRKLLLVARGEIATLADTINNMTETLRTFAGQVTTVAREVGIDGRLGGQAQVPGAAGTWKDLTENVNQLAANLTTQVRSISEVAASVTQGGLTRSVTVEARGEVLELKDTINEMIANLRDTTRTNKEQDWLKTNLARFFGMMQGQRKLEALTQLIMSELTPVVGAQHGAFYITDDETGRTTARLVSTYAYTARKRVSTRYGLGEGLIGQCLLEKKPIVVTSVPEDYVSIASGLGEAPPRNITILPVLFEGKVMGVVELGSFREFTPIQVNFLEQLMLNVGVVMNMIGASSRTEELLQELQRSNVELETRRAELEDKARQLEAKNVEIAEASESLEEKAKELDKVSRYKSQFLANMSHEIRTPLNSMLVLAQMLAANERRALTAQEVEYAETIHAAGRDLLALIDQILDLSKVEAGRLDLRVERVTLADLKAQLERTFRPVALQKQLEFTVDVAADVPDAIVTDRQLLLQVLKNLLANAFKFTERGRVSLTVDVAPVTTRYRADALTRSPRVLGFEVTDTGTGIPQDKQEIVFEAFQQADASITRQFGGTGLGLTISREYARTLGGEIQLRSTPGVGSTFVLYLPLRTPAHEGTTGHGRQEGAAGPTGGPPVEQVSLPAAAPDVDLRGRKVLVVDDDARNLFVATAALEAAGMEVLTATSGAECLELIGGHPDIEVVLMDIMMPGMSGYDAAERIHALDGFEKLPIIALSAKASGHDRELAEQAGLQDYLVKPVEIAELLDALRRHLVR